ncbi:glycosyltransferase family 4 protein [Ilyomonas limi]|uniref:Glycosyltransferase family 4 protein n=1 Tax=Ilyomonas limi TaxID=2575867 RepID=A0A4U3L1P3_9BACT|nr:glycosyltransferase family 4 protein [Ilyomonas limi]TKK67406.1 glycosyltransferase family 4 protein [Ilyomonas limi]
MANKLFFISRDANWQLYRNEVLTYFAKKYNYDVTILSTGMLKDYLKENDRLKYKLFKNLFSHQSKTSFFPGAITYIIKHKPSCVLALNNATQITEYIACILCRILGIKFVWWTHAYDHKPISNKFKRNVKDAYVKFFLSLGKAIITFSPKGKQYLIDAGIKKEKIFVAPNTLDTERLLVINHQVSSQLDKVQFLSEISPLINKQSKILLFSGRLNIYKKVHNALYALAEILKRDKNVHLIIIGDGDQKKSLTEITEQLGITGNVHFRGYIFEEFEVGKYFKVSDLFIMPGYVGLAIVHSFCFGLPIITENINFHSPEIQFLKDGINGYFVQEDNKEEMANKILDVLHNENLLSSLSKNAYETVLNEASILNMSAQMYKAINI